LAERAEDRLADFTTDTRVLLLCALAVVIGGVGALLAYALLWLIDLITNAAFFQTLSAVHRSPSDNGLGYLVILVPIVGGIVIGFMARFGSEKIRGHGIPEALEAILIGRSRIQPNVAVLKPVSSAISIGTGGPFGAEGPIIMTGGAFGSLVGQLFHLSPAERKTLLVAGAAAGMSAVFATPIAAVLLAVELLLFEWKPRSFIPVSAASLVASTLRVPLLGAGPLFPVQMHSHLGAGILLEALGCGLIAGLLSGLLTTLVYAFEDLFGKLKIHWMWWPAIGGLCIGVGGLVDPRVLGVGYDIIRSLLQGKIQGPAAIGLLASKGLVWAVALGSGTSGGVLAPLLMMGGAIGAFEAQWIPAGDIGLWTMVSMAATMGGTMRSPLTAIIFTLELTNDTGALPALLCACVAAHAVTVLLMRRSILTEKIVRRGYHITREYSIDPLQLFRVKEMMDTNVPTIPASMGLKEFAERIERRDPALQRHQAYPILDAEGSLVGIITRGDLMRAMERGPVESQTVIDAGSTNLIVAHPDDLVQEAASKMIEHDIGRLVVVDPENPKRLVGYLGRPGVLGARLKPHQEENVREPGWLTRRQSRTSKRRPIGFRRKD